MIGASIFFKSPNLKLLDKDEISLSVSESLESDELFELPKLSDDESFEPLLLQSRDLTLICFKPLIFLSRSPILM